MTLPIIVIIAMILPRNVSAAEFIHSERKAFRYFSNIIIQFYLFIGSSFSVVLKSTIFLRQIGKKFRSICYVHLMTPNKSMIKYLLKMHMRANIEEKLLFISTIVFTTEQNANILRIVKTYGNNILLDIRLPSIIIECFNIRKARCSG